MALQSASVLRSEVQESIALDLIYNEANQIDQMNRLRVIILFELRR